MSFAGHNSMARKSSTACSYLIGGGIIYLVLWIYGLVIDQMSSELRACPGPGVILGRSLHNTDATALA